MHRLAIFNYSGASLFEFACAVEMFALPRPEIQDWYETDIIAFEPSTLASTCGLGISGSKLVRSFSAYQSIVIPSWPIRRKPEPFLLTQLQQAAKRGANIMSFCSGAFLLAHAGLLNQGRATTHWRYAKEFKQQFPHTNYVDDVLYTISDNIATSAGSAAAIDLGLAIIRRDMGAEKAKMVARRLVMSPHRKGGQAQYVDTPQPQYKDHLANTMVWAQQHLDQIQSVAQLADKAAMSRRSFDRHFQAAHGTTPKRWLNHQKMIRARELLEASNAPMEAIAEQSGFASAAMLRHHFHQQLGVSPRQYRDEFSSLTNHPN